MTDTTPLIADRLQRMAETLARWATDARRDESDQRMAGESPTDPGNAPLWEVWTGDLAAAIRALRASPSAVSRDERAEVVMLLLEAVGVLTHVCTQLDLGEKAAEFPAKLLAAADRLAETRPVSAQYAHGEALMGIVKAARAWRVADKEMSEWYTRDTAKAEGEAAYDLATAVDAYDVIRAANEYAETHLGTPVVGAAEGGGGTSVPRPGRERWNGRITIHAPTDRGERAVMEILSRHAVVREALEEFAVFYLASEIVAALVTETLPESDRANRWQAVARNVACLMPNGKEEFANIAKAHGFTDDEITPSLSR